MEFLYPILFSMMPILFLQEKNIEESDANVFYFTLLKTFAIMFMVVFGVFFIIKDFNKTSLTVFLWTIIFYNAGYLYIYMFPLFKRLQLKYKLLFSAMIILLFVFVGLGVNFIPFDLSIITKVLNFISVFICISVFAKILNKYLEIDKSNEKVKIVQQKLPISEEYPDIYHIILDAYSGNEILKRDCSYDNSPFLEMLEAKGFKVLRNAKSNYRNTSYSVPSLMNFEYHEGFNQKTSSMAVLPNMFKNNLWGFLLEKNYKIVPILREMHVANIKQVFEIEDKDILEEVPNELNQNITPLKCYKQKFYFLRALFNFTFMRIWFQKKAITLTAKNTLRAFEQLKEASSIKTHPKYVFAHIMQPHSPFVFDEQGDIVKEINAGLPSVQYKNQVLGLNKHVESVINEIMGNMKENSIIILHSDHEIKNQEYDILNAMYLPDKAEVFPENLTLVNMFRYLLNHYFKTDFQILEDKFL